MNVKLRTLVNFIAGIYYNERLHMANYMLGIEITTNTTNTYNQNIALDRLHFFINEIVNSSIFISSDHLKQIRDYAKAGLNIIELPMEPYDQAINLALMQKFNSICEQNVIITEVDITSSLSDGISYQTNLTDPRGEFTKNGWWNDSELNWYDRNILNNNKESIVRLDKRLTWQEVHLQWEEDKKPIDPKKDNTVVVGKFKKKK
ncbi:uncharacterized protein METZ01_LOCUS223072 [marine metagenome]|uniref:Uncharacterized protein n=1 Tax=marine metagenome TaxID=408172 RepID=A0A382G4N5_9ZZZZ